MPKAMFFSVFFVILTSLMYLYAKNSLVLALLIVTQTLILSLIMYLTTKSSWFPFLLMMVFVTAMMVIFVYVSSLATNEFITPTPTSLLSILISSMMFSTFFYFSDNSYLTDLMDSYNFFSISTTVNKIYSFYMTPLTTFLMIYLFIALIATVKTVLTTKGPLRSMK